MDNENERNLPKLETCFQQIHHIFDEQKKKFEQKNSMLEKEKSTLFSLLENKADLEKENENLKTEIKSLKEELGILHHTANENNSIHLKMKEKYKLLKRNVTKKQSEWSSFLQIVRKQCHCKLKEKIPVDLKLPDNSMHSPIIKTKNASKIFFMSPVKTKLNISNIMALAPMTEQYNELLSPNASTPLIVGETEKNPLFVGDENDRELMCSPSLLDDKENRHLRHAAEQNDEDNQHFKNESSVACHFTKPFPINEVTMDIQDNIETSAELFSDNSLFNTDDDKDQFNPSSIPIISTKCHENIDSYDINTFIYRENMNTYRETVDIQKRTFKKVNFRETTAASLCKNSKYMRAECTQNTACGNAQVINIAGNTKTVNDRKMAFRENTDASLFKKSKHEVPVEVTQNTSSRIANIVNDADNTKNLPDRKMVVGNGNSKISEHVTSDVDKHKNVEGGFKYSAVIKKKADRAKLNGYACEECKRYYSSDNLSKEQLEEVLKQCSRHKHAFSPPSTPDQFWSIGFPNTQEYIDKGCMLDENQTIPDHAKPKWKKGKKRKTVKYQ